ncbi:NUDIX domain-containing protein [Streptomyces sp. NPDC005180]|uniref:NUDIX hydrolase n=1 Tax=Streptomyces sp. NPDC005180 TaxID=3156868 RepID=UPI0033A16715
MPPSSPAIRTTVEAYLGRHPGERAALAGLLAALDRPVEATARTTLPGHVTCSAVVIDRQGRVLHIRHRASGGLVLTPGGHIEPGDRTLLAAALREVAEEAGIAPGDLCLTRQLLGSPIDIDVHDIEANPAKREPAHRHYDFRYVFYLADEEPPAIALQDEEVSGRPVAPPAGGHLAGTASETPRGAAGRPARAGERFRAHPRRRRPLPAPSARPQAGRHLAAGGVRSSRRRPHARRPEP